MAQQDTQEDARTQASVFAERAASLPEDELKRVEDELQAQLHHVNEQRDELKAAALQLTKQLDQVRSVQTARAFMRGLPEGARSAVVQVAAVEMRGKLPPPRHATLPQPQRPPAAAAVSPLPPPAAPSINRRGV